MYKTNYHQTDITTASFLITGGAGFIGSNLVDYLMKWGAGKVRVLDNLATGNIKNIESFIGNSNFEFVEGDIRDFETCKNAVYNIDYISHQAALGSVPRSINDPLTTNLVNIDGFLNCITAAKNCATIKRFIYAASSSTYGDSTELPKVEDRIGKPLSPYAITKYVNELYADVFSKTYGFHTIGMRYFNIFGPKQDPRGAYAAVIPLFIEAAINNKSATIYGDGETTRDFTFVENAVQANIKSFFNCNALNQHEVINIAVGEQYSLTQLWELIKLETNCSQIAAHVEVRSGDIKHSLASIDKAIKLIGYQPNVTLSAGLKKTIMGFNNNWR